MSYVNTPSYNSPTAPTKSHETDEDEQLIDQSNTDQSDTDQSETTINADTENDFLLEHNVSEDTLNTMTELQKEMLTRLIRGETLESHHLHKLSAVEDLFAICLENGDNEVCASIMDAALNSQLPVDITTKLVMGELDSSNLDPVLLGQFYADYMTPEKANRIASFIGTEMELAHVNTYDRDLIERMSKMFGAMAASNPASVEHIFTKPGFSDQFFGSADPNNNGAHIFTSSFHAFAAGFEAAGGNPNTTSAAEAGQVYGLFVARNSAVKANGTAEDGAKHDLFKYINKDSNNDYSTVLARGFQTGLSPYFAGDQVSDGESGSFKQGPLGDCWILAGIMAINQTPEGEQLIRDTITENPDGTYTVVFTGDPEQTEYIVTKEDLENKNSSGDQDTAIIEEAMRQHYKNTLNYDINDGGSPKELVELLTGQTTSGSFRVMDDSYADDLKNWLLENQDYANEGMMTMGTSAWYNADGNITQLSNRGGHALTITNINETDNTISYINPWDSGKIITADIDDFAALQAEYTHQFSVNFYTYHYDTIPPHSSITAIADSMSVDMVQMLLDSPDTFDKIDTDGDGKLSRDELYTAAHNLNHDSTLTDTERAAAYNLFERNPLPNNVPNLTPNIS